MHTPHHRALLTCLLVLTTVAGTGEAARGQSAQWSAPRGTKLFEFASGLYHPTDQKVLVVIGDSINSTNSVYGMQTGYRDQFDMPFNGWVVHADNGNSDIGYLNTQGARSLDVVRNPGAVFSNGERSFSPVRARDTIWSGDVIPGKTLSDCFILNSNLAGMRRANPFASLYVVDVRLLMYEGTTQLGGFNAMGVRVNEDVSWGGYERPDPVSGSIVWIDRTAGASAENPGIKLKSDSVTSESVPGRNSTVLLGARFRSRMAPGVQVEFIAHSGWTAPDHVDPSFFTDEALRQYYAATDPPTHAMLWVGQNQTQAEVNDFAAGTFGVFKADVEAIIARHEAVLASMGVPAPRWLLVSQYKTGYDDAQHQLMAAGLNSLALDRPNISFLNLYRLSGGEAFDQATYLADGVHPSAAGVEYLARLMNTELQHAGICPVDFDGTGFVDIEDFDAFVEAFEAGDDATDFDGTGFVDIEDFDAFVEAFELGCP